MLPVSDAFLLAMAEVSAGLIGLFLVGMFFYIETGFRRLKSTDDVIKPYFKASSRIILVLFAIPIGLSLSLVVLELTWCRGLFAILSLALLAANVDTAIRVRAVSKATGSTVLVVNEIAGTVGVLALVVIPWVLGALSPSREDLTWAILLAFATGFLSVCTVVLSAFDIARFEGEERSAGEAGQEGRDTTPS